MEEKSKQANWGMGTLSKAHILSKNWPGPQAPNCFGLTPSLPGGQQLSALV